MFGTHSVSLNSLNTPHFSRPEEEAFAEGLCKKKKQENNFSLLFLFNRACENISLASLTPHCQGPEPSSFGSFFLHLASPLIICLHLPHGFGCFAGIFIKPKSPKLELHSFFFCISLTDGSFFICQCNAVRAQKCFSRMPARLGVGQHITGGSMDIYVCVYLQVKNIGVWIRWLLDIPVVWPVTQSVCQTVSRSADFRSSHSGFKDVGLGVITTKHP